MNEALYIRIPILNKCTLFVPIDFIVGIEDRQWQLIDTAW
jgi:hypothetical protein